MDLHAQCGRRVAHDLQGIAVSPRVAAILPMRHVSERVPGKNYRDFAGKPLYHRIVENLLSCRLIDTVAIDTDSELIMQEASETFPQVVTLERPQHLRDGTVSMNAEDT